MTIESKELKRLFSKLKSFFACAGGKRDKSARILIKRQSGFLQLVGFNCDGWLSIEKPIEPGESFFAYVLKPGELEALIGASGSFDLEPLSGVVKSGSFALTVESPQEGLLSRFDFEKLREGKAELFSFDVSASHLFELISGSAWACDDQSTRYALSALSIADNGGKLAFCATDGRQLIVKSQAELSAFALPAFQDQSKSLLANGKLLLAVKAAFDKKGSCFVTGFEDRSCLLACNGKEILTAFFYPFDGRFPNVAQVIEPLKKQAESLLAFHRIEPLINAIESGKVRADESREKIKIRLDDGKAFLGDRRLEAGLTFADCRHWQASFDAECLLSFLATVKKAESLTLRAEPGEGKPLFACADGTIYCLMPLRD
jgi:hypothetical protein